MPYVLPPNGAVSTLSGAILVDATTLTIQSADVSMFPGSGTYSLNLHQDALNGPWELCTVTGGQGTTNLVVTRASESFRGTQTARAWPSGTHVVPVVTQAAILAGVAVPDPLVLREPVGADITQWPGNMGGQLLLSGTDGSGGRYVYHATQDGSGDLCVWVDEVAADGTITPQAPGIAILGGPDVNSSGGALYFGDRAPATPENPATASLKALIHSDIDTLGDETTRWVGWQLYGGAGGVRLYNTRMSVDVPITAPGATLTALPTTDPHVAGQLWVDLVSLPGKRLVSQSNG